MWKIITGVVPAVALMSMAACSTPLLLEPPSVAPPAVVTPAASGELPSLAGVLPTPTPDAAAGTVPTAAQRALLAQLPSRGPAPELTNDTWFNSAPLRLADLRGKVVMVEFWTYGCINCQHVIPALQGWHATYADEGLVILGIHTPEFRYEAEPANVEAALAQYGVTWPVALDNDKTTWRAYANRYWPAMYLIDKAGNLRYLAIGEGQYAHTEAVIQALLAEAQRLDLPD